MKPDRLKDSRHSGTLARLALGDQSIHPRSVAASNKDEGYGNW